MAENKQVNQNAVTIVGRLGNVDLKTGNRKSDGAEYISGSVTITSQLNGEENIFDVEFYANKMTQKGEVSKLYETYSKLSELNGRKVKLQGEFRENRFWSAKGEQMVSAQKISGKFIQGVKEEEADIATFQVGGFVVSELIEKKNKEGNIYAYEVSIGQPNYNNTMMTKLSLHVQPTETAIINGVRGYHAGDTVYVEGELRSIVNVTTKEVDDGGFGDPIIRTYTSTQRNYFITHGSAPITDERAYARDVVSNLISAYKANDAKLAAEAKDKGSAPTQSEPKVTQRQTSLI